MTPPNTGGRVLVPLTIGAFGIHLEFAPTELSSPIGDSFVFETYAASLEAVGGGSGVFDVYRSRRGVSGWDETDRLSLPSSAGRFGWPIPGGISPDQGYSFAVSDDEVEYLRNPDGSYELVGLGSLTDEPKAQGRYISPGGSHIIFTTGDKSTQTTNRDKQSMWCDGCPINQLEPDAPPTGTGAIYDRAADGPTQVISLLPGEEPLSAGQEPFFKGASKDGTAVAFEVEGELYVRVGNEKTEKVPVSEPMYAGLSDDGRYLFYVDGGTIHRRDLSDEGDLKVNPSGEGQIVNVSADGTHVYFVSEQQLDGSKGTAGQPNLYVWAEGPPKFITTVATTDLERTSGDLNGFPALTHWTTWVTNQPQIGALQGPGADSSRTNPAGTVLVFESRAPLTTYNNADHTEIYRYDAVADSLQCVSCNPTNTEATADARLQELNNVSAQYIIHNVSDDGGRVFFETDEALVEGDTDGINDIYEWQEGEGTGSVSLISSGKSVDYPLGAWAGTQNTAPLPNLLYAITPSGSDVFFSAQEALVPGAGENGTQGIYDAKIEGGFPIPGAPILCAEELCRGADLKESALSSGVSSETTSGSGNIRARRHRHRCRRHAQKKRGKKHSCMKAKAAASALPSAESSAVSSTSSQAPPSEAAAAGASAASSSPDTNVVETNDFGIERLEAELAPTEAGAHPDFTTIFEFKHSKKVGQETPNAAAQSISVNLPPGLLGNPTAVPTCSVGGFVSFGNCSADSQVGIARLRVGDPLFRSTSEPIYNLALPHPNDEVARLGFMAGRYAVFVDIKVRTAGDYGVTATVHGAPGLGAIIKAKTTLWGNPADESHNTERLTVLEALNCLNGTACEAENGERPSTIPPSDRKAFMINPAACEEGQVGLDVTTYQLPGQHFSAQAPVTPIGDCTGLPFAPTFQAEPTSHVAGAPTGLKTTLKVPQHLGVNERAAATMREARVTLPAGMQVAAGAANWIGTCSEEEVGYHEEVDTDCPDNSKLGTATIISPALSVPIEGTIYQRSPRPGHQLGLWLTADALGMHIKLPGDLEPDLATGRLTAVFADLPQVPVEEIDLNIWGGARAPLQNPDHCGTFATDFIFSPHSNDPAATGHSDMQITEGCSQPFSPALKAGVTEPLAGKYSPFVFDLTRPDGDQALRGFELKLPDGELAKIKGVPLCADAAAAVGACPAGSRIGSIQATTGPGPDPLTIPQPGKAQPLIYLGGPYQGAPFSIVSEVPAQAGPFDLGILTVRSGLDVEPETGRAVVKADPLPQYFEGVGIAYRHLRAVVDRPEFNINPTDCREMAVTSKVTSTQGAVAHPSARFQVDGCKALKFGPKLSLKLKGGTKRAQYPALTAVLKARRGDANLASASVALPHSEFLAQEHIGTICTRKQFAADKCPKGSIYGKAKAWTPLLDKPLAGPVYLRSSDHPLPDLVAKLGGQLEIDLVGRIDSIHGGIRTTFESVPDAPVRKFVLQMRGGAKSLLTNSTDICRVPHRATVRMRAQNGRVADLRPELASGGCGGKKLGKHKKHN